MDLSLRAAGTTGRSLRGIRIAPSRADLVLGCDIVVSAGEQILQLVGKDRSRLVVNTYEMMTGDFTRNTDFTLPAKRMRARLTEAVAEGHVEFVDATRIARALMGDTIAANLFMLGAAYHKRLVPVSAEAIERAIELNGVAIPFNLKSPAWGRLWVQDKAFVMERARPGLGQPAPKPMSLEELIAQRVSELTAYQNNVCAKRYQALVDKVAAADPGKGKELTMAVARYAYKLMAYKDEYEVARLYSDGRFREALDEPFTGEVTLKLQMAPPVISKRDPETGHLRKRQFGPWMLRAMGILARFKGLRGTALDPFGKTEERRMEPALIGEYFALIEDMLPRLGEADYAIAIALASLPEKIRGFGHVKEKNVATVRKTRDDLLARLVPEAAPLRRVG